MFGRFKPAFALVLKSASRKQVFEDVFRVYWRAGQRTEPRPNGPELYMEQAFYNKLIAEVRAPVKSVRDPLSTALFFVMA